MAYWLEFWWLAPIALSICVMVRLVGVEGSLRFAPSYAVIGYRAGSLLRG